MSTGADLVAQARRVLGKPYRYGAQGPNAFDCSGLVFWCAKNLGISDVPRTSEEQFSWTDRVDTPEIGDLVFFTGAEPDPPPGHVGIVVAPGQMIDAPHTGSVVQQTGYGLNGVGVNKFMGYGRLPGVESGNISSPTFTVQQREAQVAASASSFVAVVFVVIFVIIGLIIAGGFILRMVF